VVRVPKNKDWVDPKNIVKLDLFVTDLRHTHGIGTAQSLPDFLRASGLHAAQLPKTRAAIAETYFLYALSPNNPVAQYLTPDNRSARIELKIHDLPADQVQALLAKVRWRAHQIFPDSVIQLGGMGAVVHTIHNEISHELIFGFWQALALIVLLLAVIFRSLRWAAVAALPNLVPPVFLLGYLALTHTPIKPGVAIIFSIALGFAFTNTVYVLNRLKELRKSGRPFPVRRTFHLESNPCLVATLVVMMGFSVFLFSYFELNRTFGACILVSILAGILGDLVFLPALLKTAPWLLESRTKLNTVTTVLELRTNKIPPFIDEQESDRLAA
jgi:predicted RND superfamily exporter protein